MSVFNLSKLKVDALQEFASEHDWFIENVTGGVKVLDMSINNGHTLVYKTKIFYSLEALKQWGGY